MNYTCLIVGAFSILIVLAWFIEGRKHYQPPSHEDLEVLEGQLTATSVVVHEKAQVAENNDSEL